MRVGPSQYAYGGNDKYASSGGALLSISCKSIGSHGSGQVMMAAQVRSSSGTAAIASFSGSESDELTLHGLVGAPSISLQADAATSSQCSHPASVTTTTSRRRVPLSTRRCWLPKQLCALQLQPLLRARMLVALHSLVLFFTQQIEHN